MRMFLTTAALVATVLVVSPPAAGDPPPTCGGLTATIVGTDGDDDLHGTAGADVVSLGAGDDRFAGGDGDDVVCGGPGADRLLGERGDDELYGEDGDDRMWGQDADDRLDGGAGNDMLWDDVLSEGHADGDGADTLLGGDGDDGLSLRAGEGADLADGGPGRDSVSYSTSATGVEIDAVAGTATGEAVDTLVAVEGPYVGSPHSDILRGTSGDDVLIGGGARAGEDHVYGLEGDDVVTAEKGVVDAGPGDDTYYSWTEYNLDVDVTMGEGDDRATLDHGDSAVVRGGPGRDTFEVRMPHDSDGLNATVLGGPDDDTLSFESLGRRVTVDLAAGTATYRSSRLRVRHVDEVVGSSRADTLLGGPEKDVLRGRGGDDVLRGRRGRDVLLGGRGRDVAYGGPGRDTCRAEQRSSCKRR